MEKRLAPAERVIRTGVWSEERAGLEDAGEECPYRRRVLTGVLGGEDLRVNMSVPRISVEISSLLVGTP